METLSMHIESAHIQSYRSWTIDERPISHIARDRYKKIATFEQLREAGCRELVALKTIETSRATLYRWKKQYRQHGLPFVTQTLPLA